ncbi:MAG: amino acid ABC transporter ATP-binding protein [Corynebacterium sp.]|nr:amino acid ABC transporter ATP-binding protein [Corynebacterium sp.]
MSTLPTTNQALIELRGVQKIYPDGYQALHDINLSVKRGEVASIIGPSGCGKSTLLRTINGLEEIQGGTINLDGNVIAGAAARKSKSAWKDVRTQVGMVFQNYELFPHLSVMKNLLIGPKVVSHVDPAEAQPRAMELLKRVGLEHKADAKPRELSGGQKQRVAIVRALMMQPKALLLDEITASLDPEIVREVLDVVMGLAKEGMTMLVVTHEMSFARAVSDRIIFMDAGRIVEIDEPERFFDNPQTERAQRFLNTLVF